MKLSSLAAARGIAVAGLAVTVVVGCTATKTTHTSGPEPLPTSTLTTAAALITRAFERECAQFNTTASAINADVAGMSAARALFALMATHGDDWERALAAAARVGSGPGIPAGANIARSLAANIAHDVIDLSKLRAEIGHDSTDRIEHAWNRVFTDLAATQSQFQC